MTGPFSTAPDAIRAVERAPPDCAVIDINLGDGASFELARELKRRGIPTVCVSGYQPTILPPDLQDLVHLEKPTEVPSLIKAVREVTARSR
ncbi:hypothetical protein [Bradyrhizobium sp.]|uniref:hypothetical protein n=1 Tax=Bradyrhizobium sp. TaxID=376 RepID=UPI0026058B00|nr:hypothetical protein [Bradyrhizobium sp.]